MNKYIFSLLCVLALVPAYASAHERQVFTINGKDYLFVVGSLGEPVVVDDKTAVSLRIMEADPKDIGNSSSPNVKPVEGLEKALKVELQGDGVKKTLDLSAAYKDPGHYNALFFPTKATTLSYRVFGTINSAPVDLTFTCMPGAHVMGGTPNTEVVKLSEQVSRKFQAGMFGCPQEKTELGFPIASPSAHDAEEEVHEHMEKMTEQLVLVKADADQASAGVAFGLLGSILGVVAIYRTRKKE